MMMKILKIGLLESTDISEVRMKVSDISEQFKLDLRTKTLMSAVISDISRFFMEYQGDGFAEINYDNIDKFPYLIFKLMSIEASKQMFHKISAERNTHIKEYRILYKSFQFFETADIQFENDKLVIVLKKNINQGHFSRENVPKIIEKIRHIKYEDPLARELKMKNRDLKEALEEITAQNNELNETNKGIIALYKELNDKNTRLKEVNMSKKKFISSVTHELRTPINSIKSLATLLLMDQKNLNPEQKKQVNLINTSAGNMIELINDLLDLSKVDFGKVEIHKVDFTIEDIFDDLRGIFHSLYQEKNNELVFNNELGNRILYNDKQKISQILRNFISNSMKFTSNGRVSINVKNSDERIIFEVEDNGIGISKSKQQQIFEDFNQIKNDYQIEYKGSGLGLAICRQYIDLLSGTLFLESEEGNGTKIGFKIKKERQVTNQDVKILCIDDDVTFQYIFKKNMDKLGYKISFAKNGKEGLEKTFNQNPDIIFLDINMPIMNGFEVIKMLEKERRTPMIVVITSQNLNAYEAHFFSDRGIDVVFKNEISAPVLERSIKQCLEK